MKPWMPAFALILWAQPAFAVKVPFKWLRIDHNLWQVRQAHQIDKTPFRVGYTFCQKRIILVVDYLNAWETAEVVIHEIQHGMVCVEGFDKVENEKFNNYDDDGKHDGIYFASPKWMLIIHDNPDLVKWIRECEAPR